MRKYAWLNVALLIALLMAACAAPAGPAPASSGATSGTQPQAAAGTSEFHSAYPYDAPPKGHYNTYITGNMGLGIYQMLMEPSLFMYKWADGTWLPVAGEKWEWKDDKTLEVKLISGAKWSDGSAFTSKDVVDSFTLYRLMSNTVWNFITDVKAVDDTTVDFLLKEPSTTVPRYVLRDPAIHATSVYGEWAKKTVDLVAAGKTKDDAEWKTLLQQFNEFKPADMVVLGPYKIDPATITASQMTLNKVPTSYWASKVKFDKIVNYNGETPTVTPLVLAGDVDYATHGFPPATEQEFIAQKIRVIRPPIYTGPALLFNMTIHPFELKEFRQAVAYAIDRDQNGTVSLGESGKRQVYMDGFSDNLADLWLTPDAKGKLNQYAYDTKKAEEMLTKLGFKKDTDGVWLDDKGKRLEFELTAPAEYADWSAAAENVAEQLTAFGIKTTFRGVAFQQHPIDVDDGKFQLAIRQWGAGNPHPQFSFTYDFTVHNAKMSGAGADGSGSLDKPGISFDLKQKTDSVGDVDLMDLTTKAGAGNDVEEQKKDISTLALAFNELLPKIPLWERYGNNPVPSHFAAGWLPDTDPIYKNSPYADSFVIIQILDGTLHPAD